jgi:Na+/proline symporter
MSPGLILSFVIGYFFLLLGISYLTGKGANNSEFFVSGRNAKWYLVAFGMIGASLSGVTFISIPGKVGVANFAYFQMVMGYMLGYLVIGTVLLPLYYRLNVTSIYTYLEDRLGVTSYKTGAAYFLLSRVIGAAFRLYLVAMILQLFVFEPWGVPFAVSVTVTIALIFLYTFKGGIKTIVWTDTLQTLFMLLAVGFSIHFIGQSMDLSIGGMTSAIKSSGMTQIFVWDWKVWNSFPKHFFGGAFIAIAMTGLDQDMMQKNLSCRNIGEAKKNMLWFSIVLIFVNLLFLGLGALLYLFAEQQGISIPADRDHLFPTLAIQHFAPLAGVVFLIGLIAAAYSSADSALTALTTSFSIDMLGYERDPQRKLPIATRNVIHVSFAIVLLIVILVFHEIKDRSLIDQLFIAATYTYGPLLGLFAFGILTKRSLNDGLVPIICILAPFVSFVLKNPNDLLPSFVAQPYLNLLAGYQFGFELLILNGLLTFVGLLIISKSDKSNHSSRLDADDPAPARS